MSLLDDQFIQYLPSEVAVASISLALYAHNQDPWVRLLIRLYWRFNGYYQRSYW
jgi:hypothetical protein